MWIPSVPQRTQDPIKGKNPAPWWGAGAPDGDAEYWSTAGVGSWYTRIVGTIARRFLKMKNDSRDDDWVMGLHCVTQRVAYSAFTDGGSTAGTFDLTETIPVGAWVLRTVILNVTGFAGDTSAALTVGDGTDVDRYNTSTLDVFTTIDAIDGGAISGTAIHAAEKTPKLTITSGSDWGLVTAGALTVRIYYLF
jgi:hypothetical protein